MSEFTCEVVEIRGFGDHAGADRLQITEVFGNPVIFQKGQYQKGDKAIYIPVDALVNITRPEFAFLKKKDGREWERVKALRLRGIYSEGLLVPLPKELENAQVGYDAKEELGVKKYEEKVHGTIFGGEQEADPGFMPAFDLEPYSKNKQHLVLGERVIVTEKLHGTNARFGFKNGTLHVGSHHTFKRYDPDNLYWATAEKLQLASKMLMNGLDGYVVYGEIFGYVQDLRYGCAPGERHFRSFAVYNSNTRTWLDYEDFVKVTDLLGVGRVPVLFDGPYFPEAIEQLRFGPSNFAGANHIREGFVVVPAVERYVNRVGRIAFKFVSEDYRTRAGVTTEFH